MEAILVEWCKGPTIMAVEAGREKWMLEAVGQEPIGNAL